MKKLIMSSLNSLSISEFDIRLSFILFFFFYLTFVIAFDVYRDRNQTTTRLAETRAETVVSLKNRARVQLPKPVSTAEPA